jgi:hypothetical protein
MRLATFVEHLTFVAAAMPILRINDRSLLHEFVADLETRPDIVADVVGEDAISVGILGSYNPRAHQMAVWLRVRAWEAAKRAEGYDVLIEIE